jgi:hypothetical protein
LKHQEHLPSILNHADYSSVECLKNILKVYYEIEYLAHKGYSDTLDLYLELKIAFSKLDSTQVKEIFEAISSADEDGLENAAKVVQKVLVGHR